MHSPPPISGNGVSAGLETIRRYVSEMPASAGVYRMLDHAGEVLYVGKARNLKNRVSSYLNISQMPGRLQRMLFHTRGMEIVTTASEAEALLLESSLIKHYQPRYNILLKDNKSYPYILFTGNHAFPRIAKHRGAQTAPGEYLGPFVSAGAVDETIALLQRAFLLRPCSDNFFKNRTRPCLQYQIKRCSGPCAGRISEEDYKKLVDQAKAFLAGKNDEIQQKMAQEMQDLSDSMEFEKAAQLRDRIKAVRFIQQHQVQYATQLKDTDVVALAREGRHACVQVFCFRGGRSFGNQSYFPQQTEEASESAILQAFLGQYYSARPVPKNLLLSHALTDPEVMREALALRAGYNVDILVPKRGEKKKALEDAVRNTRECLQRHLSDHAIQEELLQGVARVFNLPEPPQRIEIYDNSHIMGTHAVGGMIVAGPEGFIRRAYRKFTIKDQQLTPGDDYGMMREVLTRRFKKLVAEDWESAEKPDLVLIDGGPGQLSVASEVFSALSIEGVALASIAKGVERNAGREWFHLPDRPPFQLPPNDPVLHYLQRLRDEAHRYAIGFHRDKRQRAIRRSELDGIPAIGARRKKALLHHFGSSRAISGASVEELSCVEGISAALAKKIYDYFH